ncbi:MAG TPA: tRNA (adenosine(37)-N6)-threonylcarbamoyltransferase complex dimerization subunit type 1 TsaB [Sphingobacteriaceae bacterium]|nr:tRNA (adenosine(37)-N6)-threonylcarbamoyltransferase complex dimerization subunit type 1 TsaB [Sphingobacteriaceae bacterium]
MSAFILQLDTSTPVCTVSLSRDGKSLGVIHADGHNVHASSLTTQIAQLMEEQRLQYSDLAAVAVGKGPGSYTGLRIGVSTAKGICFAANLPLIAVDSLLMLAIGFQANHISDQSSNTLLCPMIDARRMEVYMAIYSAKMELIRATSAEIIDENYFDFLESDQEISLFGSGADKFEKLFLNHPQVKVVPGIQADAAYLSGLAYQAYIQQHFEDLTYFEPFYLKDFIPTTPKKQF